MFSTNIRRLKFWIYKLCCEDLTFLLIYFTHSLFTFILKVYVIFFSDIKIAQASVRFVLLVTSPYILCKKWTWWTIVTIFIVKDCVNTYFVGQQLINVTYILANTFKIYCNYYCWDIFWALSFNKLWFVAGMTSHILLLWQIWLQFPV